MALLRDIRGAQQRLVTIADNTEVGECAAPSQPTLDELLSGLRTAWRGGEVRATARPTPTAKRGRRRPDPFAAMTGQLHAGFLASPWLTARELLAQLQAEQPGAYPEKLLRTLQRRVKGWRSENAHRLVFGVSSAVPGGRDDEATATSGAATGVATEARGMAK